MSPTILIGRPRPSPSRASASGYYTSMKEGGTLIEYEDEDPEIRRIYEAEVKTKGIAFAMPVKTATRRQHAISRNP